MVDFSPLKVSKPATTNPQQDSVKYTPITSKAELLQATAELKAIIREALKALNA